MIIALPPPKKATEYYHLPRRRSTIHHTQTSSIDRGLQDTTASPLRGGLPRDSIISITPDNAAVGGRAPEHRGAARTVAWPLSHLSTCVLSAGAFFLLCYLVYPRSLQPWGSNPYRTNTLLSTSTINRVREGVNTALVTYDVARYDQVISFDPSPLVHVTENLAQCAQDVVDLDWRLAFELPCQAKSLTTNRGGLHVDNFYNVLSASMVATEKTILCLNTTYSTLESSVVDLSNNRSYTTQVVEEVGDPSLALRNIFLDSFSHLFYGRKASTTSSAIDKQNTRRKWLKSSATLMQSVEDGKEKLLPNLQLLEGLRHGIQKFEERRSGNFGGALRDNWEESYLTSMEVLRGFLEHYRRITCTSVV